MQLRSGTRVIDYVRLLGITAVIFCILLYFVYHILYGARGLYAYWELRDKIYAYSVELNDKLIERVGLEHKVLLLRPGHVDKDLLDEQARGVLGVAKNNEYVVMPNSR